jgi:hypothetical protein
LAHTNRAARRAAIWWVISAKKAETRLKRAQSLIGLSAKGRLIPQFIRTPAGKQARQLRSRSKDRT